MRFSPVHIKLLLFVAARSGENKKSKRSGKFNDQLVGRIYPCVWLSPVTLLPFRGAPKDFKKEERRERKKEEERKKKRRKKKEEKTSVS